ncbi:MAG: hypothetical protein G4V63_14750 [Candidatus Afipia apatlaquensis]|uniref:Uncharacterized protein n=1 Tax=Candidatus Afipia apatlaquensis TaxID=2712852 RepID=A0A7C9RFW6_9BRAD|nr:hypothetical protein [Candidatus Afipia apatlaquensis]
MTAQIIYGVVFGKPKVEAAHPDKMTADYPDAFVTKDGDILNLPPLYRLGPDHFSTDEMPLEPPCA